MSSELPSISIVIPTLNSERPLRQCLRSVLEQDYPREKIEILIVDGGSTDGTRELARGSKAKVIVSEEDRQDQEKRKGIGLLDASNEIVAFIDSDNVLPHKGWLRRMVRPFLENGEIVATQPLRYTYDRSQSLLNRYFALFGVNDPVPYYLNKRDRLSWAEDSWNLLGKAKDMGDYYLVNFEPEEVPTLGGNGFLVRREAILKVASDPSRFFHIDVNYDLISLGHNTYGIVKEGIIHLTGNTFWGFLRKRMAYMRQYYFKSKRARRYKLYTPRDRWALLKFILYSLTVIKPLWDSLKGYRKVRDRAWFLHPLACLSIVVIYGFSVISWQLSSIRQRSS